MANFLLEVDETYKVNGTRTFYEFDDEAEAVEAYHSHWRGMINLCTQTPGADGEAIKRLHTDENGRKYIKGSPFYNFPHVPHRSKIDGSEIPTT